MRAVTSGLRISGNGHAERAKATLGFGGKIDRIKMGGEPVLKNVEDTA
jgi:hypothetical protein